MLARTFVAAVLGLLVAPAVAGDVQLLINNLPAKPGDLKPADIQALLITNGDLAITFGKDVNGDFSGTSVKFMGTELASNLHGVEPRDVDAKRTFYLDYGAGRGHLEVDTVRVLENSPERAHFAVIDTHNPTRLEHHFILMKDMHGIYDYVVIRTQGGGGGGEMRTMYRFNMDILDWAWTVERTGQQPKYAFLQSISERGNAGDETWRLPDGSIYQKYDYCAYFSESPMWGHYGHGFGVFFIPSTKDSYAGGPLRQELIVHQDALILNYIGGGHFSGGGTAAGRNGEKVHGPWLLFFTQGSTEAMVANALKAAGAEQAKLPYPWVKEESYPLNRTTVTGQLKISHDRSAAGAYVILGQPGNAGGGGRGRGGRGGRGGGETGQVADRAAALYTQAGDYIFYVQADASGKFTLPNVRPGTYTLYAWQTQGPITQSLARDGVEIKGAKLDLGAIEWDPPYHPNLLMQVGKADRLAGEFKLGNVPRTNQLINSVPKDLTFTKGQSKEAEDWYFAQPGGGTWTVKFNVNKPLGTNAYLTIARAGGPGNITASVNGQQVGQLSYGDDASVRRATNRSGEYGRNEYTFPASTLKQGENALTLTAAGNGALMYDTIVLEAD